VRSICDIADPEFADVLVASVDLQDESCPPRGRPAEPHHRALA